jgi:hypothetical protein
MTKLPAVPRLTGAGLVAEVVPVVNDDTKSATIGLAKRSWTPVVTVTVYTVLLARVPVGVKVAVVPRSLSATAPATRTAEGPVNVMVVVFIVAAAISLLKVTVTIVLRGAPVLASAGVTEATVGAARLSTGGVQPAKKLVNSNAIMHALIRFFIASFLIWKP